ncbi:MAG: hypothetical protein EXR66_01020 [Dehalococcoidia bacterium]|nr:hypothetical protein [Dehalococcoidia bacterium]
MNGNGTLEERHAAARAALEAAAAAAEVADESPQPAQAHFDKASLDEEARLALQRAIMLLSVRGLPTEELRKRLVRHYTPEAVEAALATLIGTPFLDDRAWASAYVAGMRGRERSTSLLRRELRSKGVSVLDAAAAVEEHDDRAAALAAGRKRLRSLSRLEASVRTRRLRDYLLRRGFGASAVREVMSALESESATKGPENESE